jgi:hypothetical protein
VPEHELHLVGALAGLSQWIFRRSDQAIRGQSPWHVGQFRLQDEDAARSDQNVINITVTFEVEAVDEPPALSTLSTTEDGFGRCLFAQAAQAQLVGARKKVEPQMTIPRMEAVMKPSRNARHQSGEGSTSRKTQNAATIAATRKSPGRLPLAAFRLFSQSSARAYSPGRFLMHECIDQTGLLLKLDQIVRSMAGIRLSARLWNVTLEVQLAQ